MVLPLSLLKTAQNHPMLIELKNGETYNGLLVSCDSWMNVHLKDAICTSKDGDRFMNIPEVYVRGSTIKYLRIPDEVVDLVKDEVKEVRRQQKEHQKAKKNFQRHTPYGGGGGGGNRGGGAGGSGQNRGGGNAGGNGGPNRGGAQGNGTHRGEGGGDRRPFARQPNKRPN